jgi:hypothetical protein
VKPAHAFTSASKKRKLPALVLALLAAAYCATALVTAALTTPSSHSAGASSSSAAWLVDRDGAVYSMDGAPNYGSATNQWASPIVGMAATPDGGGYWEVARDGRVYPYGDAGYFGSASNEWASPIVGMVATPNGKGYWEVASDGRVYPYGDAGNFGSAGSQVLNAPIVGMAATPNGKGYWEVASDGGIFNYGNARYYGSTGSVHLEQPVVGMATTPDGHGYWMAARNGNVYSFGDAVFHGSTPAQGLAPVSAITSSPDGQGYLEAATNGALYPHGDAAAPVGSTKGMSLTEPVVGVATVTITISTGGSTTTTTEPPTTTPSTAPPSTTPTTEPPTTTPTTRPATTTPTTAPPTTTTTAPPTTTTAPAGVMAPPSGYTSSQMTFDDTFSGSSLNTSNWTPSLAPGSTWNDESLPSGDSSAGSNQAAYWAPSQATVDNGLTLAARQTTSADAGYSKGFKWVSGVITSKFTLPTSGWYVQIRAKMPDTSDGMWPALWFLPSNSAQEFDGYEGGWPGSSPNDQGHSDLFLGSGQQQNVWSTGGTDITSGYNTYGFEYVPGKSVTVYLNGKQVDQVSSSSVASEAYYLLIELQVASSNTSGWHTSLSSSTPSPSNMSISEVQVYS